MAAADTVNRATFRPPLRRETLDLPAFRRFGGYVAFGEGWALYAEGLGAQLGLYGSRRDRLRLLYTRVIPALRLIVDTGLHAQERAIDYLGGASATPFGRSSSKWSGPGRRLATRSASSPSSPSARRPRPRWVRPSTCGRSTTSF
jgi:hypothetical protein